LPCLPLGLLSSILSRVAPRWSRQSAAFGLPLNRLEQSRSEGDVRLHGTATLNKAGVATVQSRAMHPSHLQSRPRARLRDPWQPGTKPRRCARSSRRGCSRSCS